VVKNASDGTAYTIAWPSSVYWSGQYTGTTITNVQTAPTLATGANGVTTIALLTTDGGTKWRGWVEGTIPGALQNSLYAWGKGSDGGLGIGINAYRSSPVQIGALTNWSKISSGQAFVSNFGVAIKTDGTLWSWGRNNQGNLGQNNTANLSSPVQIGSDTNWSQVSCGDYAVLAVKTNGTLWSWGSNNDGKLGLNQSSVVAKSSPTQIGSATDWYLVSAGTLASFAIKTNNTLWAWGSNGGGALGDGTSVDKSSPIQIGALTNWSRISAGNAVTFATKTDGTLWSWGAGFNGGLGLGNTTSYSSPKQIGALTTWATPIGGSQRYNGFAIKTDNTLWAWGINTNGQLGQNSTVSFSSPVQVGGAEWSVATSGIATTLAVKTNGTLWGWGLNSNGIIGDSSVVPKSSPVQVGALTTWSNVSSFYTATFAISTISINPG
jgi:alpha-tubulin suppressor-like RCC1 family protein